MIYAKEKPHYEQGLNHQQERAEIFGESTSFKKYRSVDMGKYKHRESENKPINAAAVTAAAHGQWRDVLTANGVNLPSCRHHGPCPICMAGKDRFRFDDKEGRGTWVCNQCGAGDGLSLYQQATGQSMSEAIRSLASYFGLSGQMTPTDHARIEKQRQKAAKAAEQQRQREASQKKAATELANLMADEAIIIDAVDHPYLKRKCYSGFPVFALARSYEHEANGKRYNYEAGCLLHSIRDAHGEIIGAELVSNGGYKTALAGGSNAGVCVIEPPVEMPIEDIQTLFVCEGVATGYAIRELLGFKALGFAALSKNNLLRAAEIAVSLVPDVPLIVGGDVGAEQETEAAAQAVGGMVSFPPCGDWDDYRQSMAQGGAA